MRILFDKTQIQEVIDALNRTTKATVTLFDSDLNCIASAGKWQPFCLAVGEHEDLLAKCSKCNYEHTQEALKEHSILKYTCHAGIMEIVAPIFVDGNIIAYLMLGKIRDNEKVYSSSSFVEKFATENDLDVSEMSSKYKLLPLLSEQQIKDYVLITDLAVRCIATLCLAHKTRQAAEIESYIESHISESITVKDLCDKFYISSRNSLYTLIQENFGMTIKDLIMLKRINYARNALSETDLSVSAIAINAGYNGYKYFEVIFKNATGMSPKAYRQKYKNKKEN